MVKRYSSKGHKRGKKTSFTTRVLKAIRSKQELKKARIDVQAVVGNAMLGPLIIMPTIRQGLQNNERVGSEICIKSITVKGFFTLQPQTTGNGVLFRRLCVLRQRNASGSAVIANPTQVFQENQLWEESAPYTGLPSQWLSKPNREVVAVRRDMKGKVFMASNLQGNNTMPPSNNLSFFAYKLTFGKQGKILKYNSPIANTSQQFPYFCTAAVHNPAGVTPAGTTTIEYVAEVSYYDN